VAVFTSALGVQRDQQMTLHLDISRALPIISFLIQISIIGIEFGREYFP
jgi:hypothetical protein